LDNVAASDAQDDRAPSWTVWSVWRGDRAKLGLVARAIEQCFSEPGVPARVTVTVLDDLERYGAFAEFLTDAPAQTTQRFDGLMIEASGGEGRIAATLRRRGESPASEIPPSENGIVLTVEPGPLAPKGWGTESLRRVARAVTRGSVQWRWARDWPLLGGLSNYKPTSSLAAPDTVDASGELQRRNRNRSRLLWGWTALVVFWVAVICYAIARPVWEAGGLEIACVAAGCAVLAVVLALIPPLRDLVLPAIEIAERTPGRRTAARVVALATPLVLGFVARVLS